MAEPVMVRERDITCRDCGFVIDHHVVNVKFMDWGQGTAMLAGDELRDHRKSGCPGTTWVEGPWSEERPL
jgi:hypothetical protein